MVYIYEGKVLLATEDVMSLTLLARHSGNCTLLVPCSSCKAVAFLKTKLSSSDVEEFMRVLGPQATQTPLDEEIIDILQLPTYVYNRLKHDGVEKVGQLTAKSVKDLYYVVGDSKSKGIAYLREALAKHDLKLRGDL